MTELITVLVSDTAIRADPATGTLVTYRRAYALLVKGVFADVLAQLLAPRPCDVQRTVSGHCRAF